MGQELLQTVDASCIEIRPVVIRPGAFVQTEFETSERDHCIWSPLGHTRCSESSDSQSTLLIRTNNKFRQQKMTAVAQ